MQQSQICHAERSGKENTSFPHAARRGDNVMLTATQTPWHGPPPNHDKTFSAPRPLGQFSQVIEHTCRSPAACSADNLAVEDSASPQGVAAASASPQAVLAAADSVSSPLAVAVAAVADAASPQAVLVAAESVSLPLAVAADSALPQAVPVVKLASLPQAVLAAAESVSSPLAMAVTGRAVKAGAVGPAVLAGFDPEW
jgi:hypothetical protein